MVAVIRHLREPLWGLALGLLLVVLSGCDRLHEPAIYNSLDSAVELRITWEDGRVSSGTVPPLEVVHVGRVDSPVQEVRVIKDGELLASVTGTQMEELATEIDENVAGIVIEEGGIRAITEVELKRIYAK
jgi:hypothetical protein